MYAVVQIGSTILRSECITTRNVDCAAAELASANATPPATAPNNLLLTVISVLPCRARTARLPWPHDRHPSRGRTGSLSHLKRHPTSATARSQPRREPLVAPKLRMLRLAHLRGGKPVLVDQHVVDQPGAAQPRRGEHDQAPAVRLRRGEGLRIAHGQVLR